MNMRVSSGTSLKRGFTIVELVIIIFVIAILAVIAFVSYRGIKARSDNARTVSNIQQYYNAIELYRARTGAYPKVPGEGNGTVTMVCLGTGYPGGKCGKITGTNIFESATFMKELQDGSGTDISAIVNNQFGAVSNENFTGAAYGIDLTDNHHSSTGRARMIEWFLAGDDQDCKIPKAWNYASDGGNTACELDFEDF